MTMQHIIVTTLGNGFFVLRPEEGYMLYNKRTRSTYTEAVVKDKKPWSAVSV